MSILQDLIVNELAELVECEEIWGTIRISVIVRGKVWTYLEIGIRIKVGGIF